MGFSTEVDVPEEVLRQFVRMKGQESLRCLLGKVEFDAGSYKMKKGEQLQ